MNLSLSFVTLKAKLVCLNIQEVGGNTKSNSIFDFAEWSNSYFVFLQETLAARPTAIDSLSTKW